MLSEVYAASHTNYANGSLFIVITMLKLFVMLFVYSNIAKHGISFQGRCN